jgi:predicted phage terminase large subunit-like protein
MASSEVKEGTDPDWTAGVLMACLDGLPPYWIVDIQADRRTPGGIEALIKQTAVADRAMYGHVEIVMEQEPGSAGVIVIDHYQRTVLKGFHFRGDKVTGKQVERVKPLSAAAEKRQVLLVEGPWNHAFLNEAVAYPGTGKDDRVVAASGAFNLLAVARVPDPPMAGGRRPSPGEILAGQPGLGLVPPERRKIL